VTVVLTLVQTKQIRINVHETIQKTQYKQYKDTVKASTHINKTPTHYKTHTYTLPHITKQVKTTTVKVKTNTVQDTPK